MNKYFRLFIFSVVLGSSFVCLAMPQKWKFSEVGHRFSLIALKEAEKPSGYWDPSQRDCAGLIRFVYRKALGVREPMWLDHFGKAQDFASAENLVNANFHLVGRDAGGLDVRSGDILVYYNPENEPQSRFHLMLLIQSPLSGSSRTLVIYHNGADGVSKKIRKSWLTELNKNAGYDWRAENSNPRFQGVYRWNGWAQ